MDIAYIIPSSFGRMAFQYCYGHLVISASSPSPRPQNSLLIRLTSSSVMDTLAIGTVLQFSAISIITDVIEI